MLRLGKFFYLLLCLSMVAIGLVFSACSNKPIQSSEVRVNKEPVTTQSVGSISGELGYPSEYVPALYVFALPVNEAGKSYSVETIEGQDKFTIQNVVPNTYYLVAYLQTDTGMAGGYTRFALSAMTVADTDHSLLPVVVTSGQNVGDIKIADWIAPPGIIPSFPGKVSTKH